MIMLRVVVDGLDFIHGNRYPERAGYGTGLVLRH